MASDQNCSILITLEFLKRMGSNEDSTSSPAFWVEQAKVQGAGLLDEKLASYKGSQAGNAIELAKEILDREQQDIRNGLRDKREAKMLKYTKIAAVSAAAAVVVSLLALVKSHGA